MNPLGTRARAEELARLLDGGGPAPGTVTERYGALALRLRALGPAVDVAASPRPEFRAALRQRLVAVATVQGGAAALPEAPETALERVAAWSQTWTGQKRLAAASGAMAAVVAVTGVGVASTRSLPGEPFYGVKRASEALQLRLADGDTEKGSKHLEFAATRLREVRALANGEHELSLPPGTTSPQAGALGGSLATRINHALADFREETRAGRSLLEHAYRRTGKTAPLRVLTTFAQQQQARLATLIPELPPGTAGDAQASLDLVTQVATTADELLSIGTCDGSCNPDLAGPVLPEEPTPTPGESATGDTSTQDNGVPSCGCATPEPTPGPTTEPSAEPTGEPTESPTPSPSPSPSRTPQPTRSPAPGVLPTAVASLLPTDLPTILPSGLPPLPVPTDLPTILPSLAPEAAVKP